MSACERIEPLLYLFRTGELASDEAARVRSHLESCSRCAAIVRDLGEMDATLADYRARLPEMPAAGEWTDATVRRATTAGRPARPRRSSGLLIDRIAGVLRPVLGLSLTAACVLFIVEQVRDAAAVAALERRMQARGESAMFSRSAAERDAGALVRSAPEAARTILAASPIDPRALFRRELWPFHGPDRTIAEELARRYPRLADVTPGDGIDERERRILATEGAAFARELETLISKGERTP